jgi:succinoglycan biosynthesis transport protein ExoP
MSDPLVPQRWTEPYIAPEGLTAFPEPHPMERSKPILQVALEFIALLRRHLLLVFGCFSLSLGVLGYMFYTERPLYRATAVIRLANKTRSISGGLGSSASDQMGGSADPILSQLQVLQSRTVALEIAGREGLQLYSLDRAFGWKYIDSVNIVPNAKFDTLHARFGHSGVVVTMGASRADARYGAPIQLPGLRLIFSAQPPIEQADLLVRSVSATAEEIVGRLRGRARDRTDIVDVTDQDTDPARAARMVNAAVLVFQELNASSARQQSVRRRQFIEGQLHKTEAMLEEAQLQHSAFMAREHVFSSQTKFMTQQSGLAGLEVRQQELQADRKMYAGLLAALDSVPSGSAHDERLTALASSGLAANPVVAQRFSEWLKLRSDRDLLTAGTWAASPNNPDVKTLDGLIVLAQSNVLTAARAQLSSVDARLQALDELKVRTTSNLAPLPSAGAQEADLVSQVQTYQHGADQLREELQKAQIEEAAEAGQVEVVDLAQVPGGAIGTGRLSKVVFAVIIGLVMGGLASYVLENYSGIIRKRDDVERAVAMPNLGVIPRLHTVANGKWAVAKRLTNGRGRTKENGNGGAPASHSLLVTMSHARSGGAEAYRTLRTNLLFSAAVRSLRCLVITSAGPKEGKSTTAANLAVAFAQQGQRVVLVDCDLRRPRVHTLFDVNQNPGLTNLLLGDATLDQVVRPTRVPGLSVITSGPIPPNPVELLGSQQMRDVLERIESDLVVLDTPPMLVASDAAVLARAADGVLMVVRAGTTQRGALQESAQQLASIGARLVGTVLNDPDAEVAKYASYYQYYFNNYYEHAES